MRTVLGAALAILTAACGSGGPTHAGAPGPLPVQAPAVNAAAGPAAARAGCPGIPALCGMTCSTDGFGTPIFCSSGGCTCAAGYQTRSGPGGLVCAPIQPEVVGTEARDSGDLGDIKYSCSGVCSLDADGRVGGAAPWSPVANGCQGGSRSGSTCFGDADCVGTCGPRTQTQCLGGINDGHPCSSNADCGGNHAQCVAMGFCSGAGALCQQDADCSGSCLPVAYKPFDLVAVHGIAPGGEAYMPVWGHQASQCGDHGRSGRCSGGASAGSGCNTSADCPGGTCTPVGVCRGGSNGTGICFTTADCAGTCGPKTHRLCLGGTNDGHPCTSNAECGGSHAQCVAVGFCSGHGAQCQSDDDCAGQCVPVGRCSTDGRSCAGDADCPRGGTCDLARTWAGCAPDPFPFCFGLQDSDEGDFDYPSCHSSEGCGGCGDCEDWSPSRSAPPGSTDACNECGTCVDTFTSAWPFIDNTLTCSAGTTVGIDGGVSDPARIDFPNNAIVYRAPTRWESFCDERFGCLIDKDFTWDMESPGHELFDTDDQFAYHETCGDETHGRVHIEFNALESVAHFVASDWGPANRWWRALTEVVVENALNGETGDNNVRCFVKSFVNPGLTCPPAGSVDEDCSLHDPMAVVAGIPSIDCADDAYQGTTEIHPVLGMAIRIQEDPTLRTCEGGSNDGTSCLSDADCAGACRAAGEQWAFFYRQIGGTGPCGGNAYSRCLSAFKLGLGFPEVPGGGVLTGADVRLDWHAWKMDDSAPTDVDLTSTFDLTNGTVLNVTLPHFDEGVVGLVTVRPRVDTSPPQISCPGNVRVPADLGRCSAAVSFAPPTVSDNCSASAGACDHPSGSAFPLGTTRNTCRTADQAGLPASCTFEVTVTAGDRCPREPAYWREHRARWPVHSLVLGSATYDQGRLLDILDHPGGRDASVFLAKAEIAALLSLASGSDPTSVCGAIADANGALGSSSVPAHVDRRTPLGERMVKDGDLLQRFNAGALTPGCLRWRAGEGGGGREGP